jgi:hypothetical protein
MAQKEFSFDQKKKIAKQYDKKFKRHKKAFDDADGKTGDFDMPVYWLLVFRFPKEHLGSNWFLVESRIADIINVQVRLEKLTWLNSGARTKKVSIDSYTFVPVKSSRAKEQGFDTDSFVVEFNSEASAKLAMETFAANDAKVSFVTAEGSALTLYTTNEVTA